MTKDEIAGKSSAVQFCNLNFNLLHKNDLFVRADDELKCIATVNAQFIVLANTNARYMNYINNHYATFDGEIPLKKAKKTNALFKLAEKLPGSEIVYDFAQFAKENGLKLFFLGGAADSNLAAVQKIREKYGVEIMGFSPDFEGYPFSEGFVKNCRIRIEAFRPDILFVGFGAPKQEFFIEDNCDFLKSCGVKWAVGSGGTFDFVSGKIARAPRWIQRAGLESVFRFCKEISWMRFKRILYSLRFYRYVKARPEFAG